MYNELYHYISHFLVVYSIRYVVAKPMSHRHGRMHKPYDPIQYNMSYRQTANRMMTHHNPVDQLLGRNLSVPFWVSDVVDNSSMIEPMFERNHGCFNQVKSENLVDNTMNSNMATE